MKKIVVPEGMLESAKEAFISGCVPSLPRALTAALQWLSENPIAPTIDQLERIWNSQPDSTGEYPYWQKLRESIVEWQKRMFLAPDEEEIPEAIKQAICDGTIKADPPMTRSEYDYALLEAYRRGQKAGRNG